VHENDKKYIRLLKRYHTGALPQSMKRIIMVDAMAFIETEDGGPGSGNFNHSGREGQVGGSSPSGSGGGSGETSGGLNESHVTNMKAFHKAAIENDKSFLGSDDDIDATIKKQYKRDMGLLFDSNGNPYDFAHKCDSFEEWAALPFSDRVSSYIDYDEYKKNALETTPWACAAPGSICDTLQRYNCGATPNGYGKGKGQRLLFDKETGLSDYIDSHPELHYNGGTVYRGIETSKAGLAELKKALKNGTSISMRGPSSWSIDERVAKRFTEESLRSSGRGTKVVFAEEGTKKRDAIPFPYSMRGFNGNQQEVLYSGNVNFKVKSIEERGGVVYVRVESEG